MDDLTTLREAWERPAPPSREAYFEARAALMSRTAPAPRRRRLPRMGVRLVAAGAFAVVLAAGVTVVQNLAGDRVPGVPAGPAANAQEALERAALVAESKPYTAPRPNQWIYTVERTTESVEGRPAGSTDPLSRVNQEWRRVDGTQSAYLDGGKLRVQKTPQPPAKHRNRVPKPVRVWEEHMRHPATLPAEPDAILRLAYDSMQGASNGAGPVDRDELVYTAFTHLLRENLLPPKVEAAVFRAVAKIPGVTLDKNVTDVLGRPAYNLGMTTGGNQREDLLLDRKTYAYLGERSLTLEDELSGKIYPDRKVLVKKNTEFVFARTTTKIVDRAGETS